MTPAEAATMREHGAELRAVAARGLAVADELDATLAAAGFPTSATDATVIDFPVGRRAAPWSDVSVNTAPRGAEIIDLAQRRTGAR